MADVTSTVYPVSRKAAHLVGSEIIRLAGEIRALQAQGAQIYNLTIGDFNPELFPIPQQLKRNIIDAYEAGMTNYPPANGLVELREALSEYISDRQGLDYNSNEYLVAGGARPLIYAVYQAIVDPGDKVIFPTPSWNNNHYSHLSDAMKVQVDALPENAFMPTAEAIAPSIQEAALIAVCSPLNPTGTVFPKEQLEAICDMVIAENKRRGNSRKPLYLLYDQIYWQLTFGETVHYDPVNLRPEMRDYTIFIDGISKCFAATGVRVGWSFGPPEVIGRMKSILGHVGAWAPRAEQYATAKFLKDKPAVDEALATMKDAVYARLSRIHEGFQALKAKGYQVDSIAPRGAIYLTVNLNLKGKTTPAGKVLTKTDEVHSYILESTGLASVPFYAFGADRESDWYRLSVGTAKLEEMDEMFERLDASLAQLG